MVSHSTFNPSRLFLLKRCLFSTISTRSRKNLLDHRSLGISVVLCILPVLASKLPLGALVQPTIICMAAQPVAEEQHTLYLWATLREDMQVDVHVWPLEHT